MHNCRETRERLTELLLDGVDCEPDDVVSELRQCGECRAEFDALNATLRMTTRLQKTATSAESYWTGYHARLRQRLTDTNALCATSGPEESRAKAQRRKEKLGPLFASLRPGAGKVLFVNLLKSSIPVPLPLGVAIIVAGAFLLPLAMRAGRQEALQSNSTTIVRVPVGVQVVEEKIVTKVVYRDRRSVSRASNRVTTDSRVESTFARSQKPRTQDIPASLNGFKPTEEIKLTVIKGGFPNEK